MSSCSMSNRNAAPLPRVAVIGGGPAGLFAAEHLRAAGLEVDLY
ncbi:NAD(P)-binding protein, partial [Acinetobacter baumannii]